VHCPADFVSDIAGVSGGQAQVKAAVSPRPQLAQEADLTPEEVAEREAIRREIQDKMAAMRRQSQANPSQAISVSPPRAVTSPVASPPRAVKSPVASPVLMQQQVGFKLSTHPLLVQCKRLGAYSFGGSTGANTSSAQEREHSHLDQGW